MWRRTGVNPVTFRSGETAHDYIGRLFKMTLAALFGVTGIYAFVPHLYHYLLPVFWLQLEIAQYFGAALLIVSFVWTVFAQVQMGNSWRIGIDEENRPALVSTGVFSLSRNPIFLGMLGTLLGIFLIAPNAFTLLICSLGFVLIQIQVRLEEEFLEKTHDADYDKFRRVVRRWL